MILITVRETRLFAAVHTAPCHRLVGMVSRLPLNAAIQRMAQHAELYTERYHPQTISYSVVAVTGVQDLCEDEIELGGMVNVESLCTTAAQMAAEQIEQEPRK